MEDYVFCRKHNIISAGACHIVALKPDGTVLAAGSNTGGECDVSDWINIMDIQTGPFYTLGLRYDGTLVCAGMKEEEAAELKKWKNLISVTAGSSVIAGLKADGTVVTYSRKKMFRIDENRWKDIKQISAGSVHLVGLKEDGSVIFCGEDVMYDPNAYLFHNVKEEITSVHVGNRFVIYRCAGETEENCRTFGKAFYEHSMGGYRFDLMETAVGDPRASDWKELWNSTPFMRLGYGSLLGICRDGTVRSTGNSSSGKIKCSGEAESAEDISGWKNIVDIDSGVDFVVAADRDGAVKLAGYDILRWVVHPLKEVLNWKLFDTVSEYRNFRNAGLQFEHNRIRQELKQAKEALETEKPGKRNKKYQALKAEVDFLEMELLRIKKLQM